MTEIEQRIENALNIAWEYGQIDGSHHKMWVIDQMVRALIDSEPYYKEWVKEYEGNDEYEWNIGIEP